MLRQHLNRYSIAAGLLLLASDTVFAQGIGSGAGIDDVRKIAAGTAGTPPPCSNGTLNASQTCNTITFLFF